jgi:hypothetical protein
MIINSITLSFRFHYRVLKIHCSFQYVVAFGQDSRVLASNLRLSNSCKHDRAELEALKFLKALGTAISLNCNTYFCISK